ncbi:hypothetical protein [Jeotgalibacillus terrae]|uniref:Uncharacterized protein n=1 Tax=Jeotgalibacillus terrae TaxID=587735 RepID=A0ABW5ZET1_9BACL|nr:hypothetical protein [Jeotgalibacillus terrae]MBM7580152.1 flagellin-like hook-associated protein FlgL [Jeotgalibacillus terrae]
MCSTVRHEYADVNKAAAADQNGWVQNGTKVELLGDARPDAIYGNYAHLLQAYYVPKMSVALNQAGVAGVGAAEAYCDHTQDGSIFQSEILPDSLEVRLNGSLLNDEQFTFENGRVTLIPEEIDLEVLSQCLQFSYDVRQGTAYGDNEFIFQTGANAGMQKEVSIASFDNLLETVSMLCVREHDHASQGLNVVDQSLAFITNELGNMGAVQNSLEHIASNLANQT